MNVLLVNALVLFRLSKVDLAGSLGSDHLNSQLLAQTWGVATLPHVLLRALVNTDCFVYLLLGKTIKSHQVRWQLLLLLPDAQLLLLPR